jgi:prepilin-type N-terminal cleavage/methylation domain-containing protein
MPFRWHTPESQEGVSAGFTLVEMSIVLVIIGLLVGTIVGANVIIESGQMRKAIADIDNLKKAVGTFELKYNCLPGDCANASNLFSGLAASQANNQQNGDGNGKYETYTQARYGEGAYRLWEHLNKANLTEYGPFIGQYTSGNPAAPNLVPGSNVPLFSWGANVAIPNYWTGAKFSTTLAITYRGYCFYGYQGCEAFQVIVTDPANYGNGNRILMQGFYLSPTASAGGFFGASVLQSKVQDIDTKTDNGNLTSGRMQSICTAGACIPAIELGY